ncbi:MAG: hypothetical protein CSA62_01290 [Planctomycetota bacterium]|nr:MAG: hypothetical protein CSA62_01290 [Planctomycetota bacterium]
MNTPKNAEERARQAERIRSRASETRLLPDENGNLVKHRQADDGRWVPVEKVPLDKQQPQRSRPIQISTGHHKAEPSQLRAYLLLAIAALTISLGLIVGLPYLTHSPKLDRLTPPKAKPAQSKFRSVVLVSTLAGRSAAGFVLGPRLVVTDARILKDVRVCDLMIRFSDGSSKLGAKVGQLRWVDEDLVLAVLSFEGKELALPLASKLPDKSTPIQLLHPKVGIEHQGVLIEERECLLGLPLYEGEEELCEVLFQRQDERSGTPVCTQEGQVVGLLLEDNQEGRHRIVPAPRLQQLLDKAHQLGPGRGRKLEAVHDAGVLASNLIQASERYGMAAMAIGLALSKQMARGEALEMGLQQAHAALSNSLAEADAYLEGASTQYVEEITSRPELPRALRGLILQLSREVRALRKQVERPRGTVMSFQEDSKKKTRRIEALINELRRQLET